MIWKQGSSSSSKALKTPRGCPLRRGKRHKRRAFHFLRKETASAARAVIMSTEEYRQRQNRKDPQVACLQSSRANFLIRLIVIIRDPQNQNSSPDSPILPKDPQRSLSNFFPLEKCVPRVNASRAPTANHKPRTSKKSSLGVCINRIRTCVRFTASNLDRREEAQEWNERTRNGRAAVIFPKLS